MRIWVGQGTKTVVIFLACETTKVRAMRCDGSVITLTCGIPQSKFNALSVYINVGYVVFKDSGNVQLAK